jgi:hypothetical protein
MAGGADHIMAHFWAEGAAPEVATNRHRDRSEFIFVDGHVILLPFHTTYNLRTGIDLWNPDRGP